MSTHRSPQNFLGCLGVFGPPLLSHLAYGQLARIITKQFASKGSATQASLYDEWLRDKFQTRTAAREELRKIVSADILSTADPDTLAKSRDFMAKPRIF